MTESLNVTPSYLQELASEQDEAAAKINEASQVVDGTAKKLWFDHGPVCFNSVNAMMSAEQERLNACSHMIAVSNDLAAKLRTGATEFESTNEQSAANLGQQMLPG
ncbi:ESX-1 secretion-associated protein EspC [Mycobacterium lentiflavum]|uniref:ESX-1 secretion-associated protein EspC n=1 Tax=Mycobacterium lentiflavum TaxID=141349 RepID=A0A0E4CPD7_MYCLN|nr:ESX-1 secretion-associated protein [Mycobacterium lentiflavum]CQD17316.1 ESX-1 secretion-associated protein EspC [Mycobacterium lentiflavum]